MWPKFAAKDVRVFGNTNSAPEAHPVSSHETLASRAHFCFGSDASFQQGREHHAPPNISACNNERTSFSTAMLASGFGYIAIDTANGCIFLWIRSGVGSARSYVQGTLRALGKHRSWMLCEDPVSNSFEVFVCIPKIASQGRFVGVISITYYGYILRDAFGFPFRIDIGTNISIRAAQDEESTSSWFGQLLARWLSSVRQALRYDTG